jgi:hypothetical protein
VRNPGDVLAAFAVVLLFFLGHISQIYPRSGTILVGFFAAAGLAVGLLVATGAYEYVGRMPFLNPRMRGAASVQLRAWFFCAYFLVVCTAAWRRYGKLNQLN